MEQNRTNSGILAAAGVGPEQAGCAELLRWPGGCCQLCQSPAALGVFHPEARGRQSRSCESNTTASSHQKRTWLQRYCALLKEIIIMQPPGEAENIDLKLYPEMLRPLVSCRRPSGITSFTPEGKVGGTPLSFIPT